MLLPSLSISNSNNTGNSGKLFIYSCSASHWPCLLVTRPSSGSSDDSIWLTDREEEKDNRVDGKRTKLWRREKAMHLLTLWCGCIGKCRRVKRKRKNRWEWNKGEGSKDRQTLTPWMRRHHVQSITHFLWTTLHHTTPSFFRDVRFFHGVFFLDCKIMSLSLSAVTMMQQI